MTAEFPEKITTQLKTAVNNLKLNLDDDVGENDDEIFVQTTSGAPASGSFHIENEIIFYPTKTSLKFGPGLTRGADGTTKAVHLKIAEGGEVVFGPEAHFVNTPNDEIIATQTKVGKDDDPNTDSHDYKLRNLPYGKNLIRNGAFIDSDGDNLPDFFGLYGTPTLAIAADTLFPARGGNQITITSTGGGEALAIVPGESNWLKVLPSTKYTISFDYKVTAGDFAWLYVQSYNGAVGGSIHHSDTSSFNSTVAIRDSRFFTTDADADNVYIHIGGASDTDVVTISHLKLEQGAVATPYIEDNADLVDNLHGSDIAAGWFPPDETWTYASADDPTFTFTISGDKTSKYSAGMRIKLTQTTVKYFIITKVAYSSPNTTVTIYGGTDYDLVDAAITNPYYSTMKAPQGFPLDPNKWTVELLNTTDSDQASPTQNTWYNVGSITISIPIGIWNTSYQICVGTEASTATGYVDVESTLSTANNSESDADLTGYLYVRTSTSDTDYVGGIITRLKTLVLTAKTSYYLNLMTPQTGIAVIRNKNSVSKCIIRAVCSYL